MSFVYLETQFLRGAFTLCMCPSSRVDLPHRESSAGRLGKCFFPLFVLLTFCTTLTAEFLWKCAVLTAFEISCLFLASEVKPSRILSLLISTLNEGFTMCLEINQFMQYVSQHNLLFYSKLLLPYTQATCFDCMSVIFRPYTNFLPYAFCPLWDPVVFTVFF